MPRDPCAMRVKPEHAAQDNVDRDAGRAPQKDTQRVKELLRQQAEGAGGDEKGGTGREGVKFARVHGDPEADLTRSVIIEPYQSAGYASASVNAIRNPYMRRLWAARVQQRPRPVCILRSRTGPTRSSAMPYTLSESADAVILTPVSPASAAVIWLHGLGADGHDFVPIVEELQLPASLPVRFIFPHARIRPVTINNGYEMRAWYDIKGFGPERVEDEEGIRESAALVSKLVEAQAGTGIDARRIVLAGFSQGGAIALQAGLRFPRRLAGIMPLSTYLPLAKSVPNEASQANRDVPILMCHGLHDGVIPAALGAASREMLTSLGYRVQWQTYSMEHSVCMEEIAEISTWLQKQLATTQAE
jgi:phospholipase/carboxylesterase